MNTTKYRVSLGYANLNDNSLLTFATTVHSQLYVQAAYPTPPVTAVSLLAGITALRDAKVAQVNGGKAATAVKNQCREALADLLRQLAFYVQLACGNDLAVLLDSGFEPVSTNRTQTQLVKPVIVRINPGLSGEALVTVTADANARSFEVRVAEVDDQNVPGPFRPPVIRTGSRNMSVEELVPGKLCVFQVRAVGGLTGFSDWSDAVVQRAA
jgi:xanthine/CO dehydrogenase XdhC/CoxF family maturation factor